MSIQKGDQAPAFTLFNSDKKEISLEDFKGKSNVLLLFFPLAFTGVCTTELCSVRDAISVYEGADATVLGISVDSLFTLEKFKAEQNLNFDLLSDFGGNVAESYGALYEEFPAFGMKRVGKRSAFVIDKEGTVQYTEVLASPGDLPNFEAIQKCLKTLN